MTRQTWRRAAVVGLGLLLGLCAGLAAVEGRLSFVAAAVTLVVWVVLVRQSPGTAVGIWVLALTNTVPGFDLGASHTWMPYNAEDLLVPLLVLTAVVYAWWHPTALRRLPRWLVVCAVAFGAWWVFGALHAAVGSDVPIAMALKFGRDLLYGYAAVISCLVLIRNREDVRRLITVAVAGAVLFGGAFLVRSLSGYSLSFIIHPTFVSTSGGIERVHQGSQDLVMAMLFVTAWVAIGASGARRTTCAAMAALFAGVVALQQTRAAYVGVSIGALASIGLVYWRPAFQALRTRAHVVLATAGLASLLLIGLLIPAVSSTLVQAPAVSAVVDRVQSIGPELEAGSSSGENWGYRVDLFGRMWSLLDGDLLWGIGFLHPESAPVYGLPDGSVRNSDTGLFEVLMPLGLVGLALLLAPVVGVVGRRPSQRQLTEASPEAAAALVGIQGYLIGALASSLTLVVFFLGSGPPFVGVMLACSLVLGGIPVGQPRD